LDPDANVIVSTSGSDPYISSSSNDISSDEVLSNASESMVIEVEPLRRFCIDFCPTGIDGSVFEELEVDEASGDLEVVGHITVLQ
jgi:hypothetical protein